MRQTLNNTGHKILQRYSKIDRQRFSKEYRPTHKRKVTRYKNTCSFSLLPTIAVMLSIMLFKYCKNSDVGVQFLMNSKLQLTENWSKSHPLQRLLFLCASIPLTLKKVLQIRAPKPLIEILSPGNSAVEGHLCYCHGISAQCMQMDLKTQQDLYTAFMYAEYKSG